MALSGNTNFECRAAGSDNNGGGYVSGGTDRSQQNAAQVAIDNATITTSITGAVVTFTGGYTVLAGDVGNLVQFLTGTNLTAGFYQITAVSAGLNGTWTLDRTPLSSGTTTNATGNMGGALATPGKANAAATTVNQIVWFKGAFALTGAALTQSASVTFLGYGTTRGDNVQSAWDATGMTAGSNTINLGAPGLVRNIAITGSQAIAFNQAGGQSLCVNCTSTNSLSHAFSGFGSYQFNCLAIAPAGTGFNSGACAFFCYARGATGASGHGFNLGAGGVASYCVAQGNAQIGFTSGGATNLSNCVAYGNGSFGFKLNVPSVWVNLVAYGNTGAGYAWNSSGAGTHGVNKKCFAGSNTGGATTGGNATLDDAITNLTADPFTNAASFDFSLNTTAGGGALLRAAGWDSILGTISSGFLDAGAIQHQDVTRPPASPIHPGTFHFIG